MRKLAAIAFAAAALPVALAPVAHASDEVLRLEQCPEGTRGVVIGVTTSETGERHIFACIRPVSWN
ncbi:MAG: hypothetical protein M3217_07835 [Actinomycetota bacterium]|nr:hypothetical protein [Actinomycetota bacterium]